VAAINRSKRRRVKLTTMAAISEALEVGPEPFAAPIGVGLTKESQDENIRYETGIKSQNETFSNLGSIILPFVK